MPDSSVSIVTANAPIARAVIEVAMEAAAQREGELWLCINGLNINGYATKHDSAAIFSTLQPSVINPPSANSRHCTMMTEVRVRNPAHSPSTAASSTPPTMCPLDPVAGIAKLSI